MDHAPAPPPSPAAALGRIAVVLVEPSHPGNIGAVARAMKNFGLSDLRLAAPPGGGPPDHLGEEAEARASGADDLLHATRVFPDLGAAVADARRVIATSSRIRPKEETYTPREIAPRILAEASSATVALVFGAERTGLTNGQLALCQDLVRIPADPAFGSLNLAQAVVVLGYELRLAAAEAPPAPPGKPARSEEFEAMVSHFERALDSIGLFPGDTREARLGYLRRVLGRSRATGKEVRFLRGIAARIMLRMGR